uniref:C2 domain-containing protein n=1 Tax=Timema bartmani TaxID=61472 RepID=A0A7R9ER91_9NEOP|nr:unnamed protein product [Timema bartmani]
MLSVDRPDPYLILWTPGTPHGRRKTRTVKNTYRPVWDQRFDFVLDPQHDTELRVHLMDRGVAVDQLLGKVRVDISGLPLDKELYQELRFPHAYSAGRAKPAKHACTTSCIGVRRAALHL